MKTIQRVIIDDCRKFLKTVATHQFHLCVTDPPYRISNWENFGTSKEDMRTYGTKPLEFREWLPELKRILRGDASIFIWEHPNNLPELLEAMKRYGFFFHRVLIWHVPNRNQKWYVPGHPINMHDVCVYATKDPQHFTFNGYDGSFVDVYRHSNIQRGTVPGVKPLSIIRTLIRATSNPGDWVIDPFLGRGTTLRACRDEGRNGVGIEVRPELEKEINSYILNNVESLESYI